MLYFSKLLKKIKRHRVLSPSKIMFAVLALISFNETIYPMTTLTPQEALVRKVGAHFANIQMVDLGAVFVDVDTPENRILAQDDLTDSLRHLTTRGAGLFAHAESLPMPGPLALCPPFISGNERRIIFSPFCNAGRNRSQVLHAILQESFGDDPRVIVRPPHGSVCGLDPYQNRDGSWSYLNDKGALLRSTEDRSDEVMFNATQKGFFERFGRLKTHRMAEDMVFDLPSWDAIAMDDTLRAQRERKKLHDYFTVNYYRLQDPETTYVFIGFREAFHRLVSRIMEANTGQEDFSNLVLVAIDYPDLISYTRTETIPDDSAAAYARFYNLLREIIRP